MTAKEQKFEDLVNARQAEYDVESQEREWARCRELERNAICLYRKYQERRQSLDAWAKQQRTDDQHEMEFRCQRNRQKREDLNPQKALAHLRAMESGGEKVSLDEAVERVKMAEVVERHGWVMAELTAVVRERELSGEEKRRRFMQQVQSVAPDLIRNFSPTRVESPTPEEQETLLSPQVSPARGNSASEDEQERRRSQEAIRREFKNKTQASAASLRGPTRPTTSASPAAAQGSHAHAAPDSSSSDPSTQRRPSDRTSPPTSLSVSSPKSRTTTEKWVDDLCWYDDDGSPHVYEGVATGELYRSRDHTAPPTRPSVSPPRSQTRTANWVAGLVTHGDGGHEGTSVGTRFRELEMRGYGDVRVADRVQRRLAGRGGDKRVVNEALQRHLDWMERSGTSFSGLPRSAWTVLPSDRFG